MLIRSLSLENLLSFEKTELELGPLNVLIGPNASGKSNLIAAIGLLRAAATDLNSEIVRGGGVREWVRKSSMPPSWTSMACDFDSPVPLRYRVSFAEQERSLVIKLEALEEFTSGKGVFSRGGGWVRVVGNANEIGIESHESALSRLRGLTDPATTRDLGKKLSDVRVYHEFNVGPRSQVRNGIAVGVESTGLWDGGDNLALVLHEMYLNKSLDRLNAAMQRFYESFDEVQSGLAGGVMQIQVRERGLASWIPGIRLSDGTLRMLCLLAVLYHHSPPPMVCIEEPELGLHPDAIEIIAKALVDASKRTQLVVTTHSRELVDSLTDQVESVIVCERGLRGSTEFRRLDAGKLEEWLELYSLGEIWSRGEIGGNRW